MLAMMVSVWICRYCILTPTNNIYIVKSTFENQYILSEPTFLNESSQTSLKHFPFVFLIYIHTRIVMSLHFKGTWPRPDTWKLTLN